jgi:predicted negative regulator of RcsB-dependent stress response
VSNDDEPTEAGTEAIRDRNRRVREEAAQKRRKKREAEARPAVVRGGLDAGELVDDALARGTHTLTSWLKRNASVIQWVVVLSITGGIGFQIYRYQRDKTEAAATDELMEGLAAELARVGDAGVEPSPMALPGDTRESYPDDKARLEAAEKAYSAALGDGELGTLARMGLAGVLFDQGKFKEALVHYRAVRQSKLAERDSDLRCRAIEGAGLSEEGLGNVDGAMTTFGELAKSDVPGFAPLGLYHQARLHAQKGQVDKAKELLKSALEKLEKARGSEDGPSYTEQVARDLLRSLDPTAEPAQPRLTPAQIQALTEQASGGPGEGIDAETLKRLLGSMKNKTPSPAPSGAPSSSP